MGIHVDYLAEERAALIRAQEDCSQQAWSAVRRVCEDHCDDLTHRGERMLSMPWWSFLAMRSPLASVLQQRGLSLRVSEVARSLLQEARRREDEYAEAERRTWSEQQVRDGLERVGFARRLLPYQIRNVCLLASLPAAATFSVPGSGKTTEALATYFLTRADADRLLVIAPKNAFMAWEEELPQCMPTAGFDIARLTGGSERVRATLAGDPVATIITYHQLQYVIDDILRCITDHPTHLVVDESHRMKRGTSGVFASCILRMAHIARRKLILSGTPMPNAVIDLVAQFQFLYPEIPVTEEDVIERVRSIYTRTTKSELGLPTPIRTRIPVPMSPGQERLYRALQSDAARRVEGLRVRDRLRFRAFARCILHMIQAASNPALLAHSDIAGHELLQDALADGVAPKIQEASRIAREQARQGRKTVIWSAFVQNVEHVAALLGDLGAEFVHGGVGTSEDDGALDSREAKIRRFNDPESDCMVLVANPAACSEGISLHRICHHAVYLDRTFNAAHYLQSEDRIHRIGLSPEQNTYISRLHAPDSIDDVVEQRLDVKVARMGEVLNDPDLNIQALDLDSVDEDELPGGFDPEDFGAVRQMLLGGR